MVFKGEVVSCSVCSGTGFVKWKSGNTLTCSICKGTGKVAEIRKVGK